MYVCVCARTYTLAHIKARTQAHSHIHKLDRLILGNKVGFIFEKKIINHMPSLCSGGKAFDTL